MNKGREAVLKERRKWELEEESVLREELCLEKGKPVPSRKQFQEMLDKHKGTGLFKDRTKKDIQNKCRRMLRKCLN